MHDFGRGFVTTCVFYTFPGKLVFLILFRSRFPVMFDIDTDKLARLFNGEIVEEDNFDDAMEENEYEPPEQEQTIQETKNQAQPIANGSLPPSAIREKKRAREDDLDTVSEKKRPREDDTETETGKRIRSGDEPTASPIVADTFEQETSREVVNAPGLQAAAPTEGENITLSHQVRKTCKPVSACCEGIALSN